MAISQIGTKTTETGVNTNSITKSYTLVSGSDRVLVVGVGSTDSFDGGSTVSTVTYNGVSLTKQAEADNTIPVASIWTLVEASLPSNGAHNVVVTFNGSETPAGSAIVIDCFESVDSVGNTESTTHSSTASYNQTQSPLDTSVDSLIVEASAHAATTGGSAKSGQTNTTEISISGGEFGYSNKDAGTSSSTTIGYESYASGDSHAQVAIELVETDPINVSPSPVTGSGSVEDVTLSASGSATISPSSLSGSGSVSDMGDIINTDLLLESVTSTSAVSDVGLSGGGSASFSVDEVSGAGSVSNVKIENGTFVRVQDPTGVFTKVPDPTGTFTRVN